MSIKNNLKQLAQAYEKIIEANRKFLDNIGADPFRRLIDQRALIIEDIEIIAKSLAKEINHIYREHSFSCRTVPEAIRALLVLAPELSDECEELKKALKALVTSDAEIETQISQLKEAVKDEIFQIRKSSKVLKGYKQADPMGSCFINKIR
jgi:hypothetical protein